METRIVETKLRELEKLMSNLRSAIDSEKRSLDNLEDEKQMLYQTAGNKKPVKAVIVAKDREKQEKQNRIEALEKHLSEADDIYAEMKKQQGALQDIEQNVKTWMGQANNILR